MSFQRFFWWRMCSALADCVFLLRLHDPSSMVHACADARSLMEVGAKSN
jgi:hypothetical protein